MFLAYKIYQMWHLLRLTNNSMSHLVMPRECKKIPVNFLYKVGSLKVTLIYEKMNKEAVFEENMTFFVYSSNWIFFLSKGCLGPCLPTDI